MEQLQLSALGECLAFTPLPRTQVIVMLSVTGLHLWWKMPRWWIVAAEKRGESTLQQLAVCEENALLEMPLSIISARAVQSRFLAHS